MGAANADTLDQLLAIITSGVANIKKAYAKADIPIPHLNDLYTPDNVEESVSSTTMLVVAAATQLISTLRNPGQLVTEHSYAPALVAGAIGTVMKAHIPELIREAGPKGVHVKEICAPTSTNSAKMARLMRLLASRHIFRELEPNVFVHNRLSCMLDTGKSSKEILADPVYKYRGSEGIGSLVDFGSNDTLRGAAMISESMIDPEWSSSEDGKHAPLCRAVKYDGTMYDWHNLPGNEAASSRFNEGMTVNAKNHPPRTVLDGFPWKDLAPGSLVVDVGGGVGSAVLALLGEYPQLKYAVQDLPVVIADARAFWARENPQVVEKGSVLLQEQSFFDPQPKQDVSVFILRYVTHNWSTGPNRAILKQLAQVAKPETRVVIIDHVVPYTSVSLTNEKDETIPGARGYEAPAPLLPSAGREEVFDMDILMMTLLNAQERTIGDFVELVQGTGWAVTHIYRGSRPGGSCQVVLSLR